MTSGYVPDYPVPDMFGQHSESEDGSIDAEEEDEKYPGAGAGAAAAASAFASASGSGVFGPYSYMTQVQNEQEPDSNHKSWPITDVSNCPVAPVVEIDRIGPTTVTVRLTCDSDEPSTRYQISYCELQQSSDLKIAQCTKRREKCGIFGLAPIRGLFPNTKYVVYGSYRVMETGIWSELSSPLTFTTLNWEKQRGGIVFAHWLRTLLSAYYLSNEVLVNIMLTYYPTLKFEWNPLSKHDSLTLSNDGKCFSVNLPSDYYWSPGVDVNWLSLCSATAVSADMCIGSIFRWELTQKNGGRNLKMGFIDSKMSECFGDFGEIDGSAAITYRFGNCSDELQWNMYCSKEWLCNLKMGSVFTLEFDFSTNECSAFCNGQLMEIISTNLPRTLYPVVSVGLNENSFETTFFDSV